MPTSSVNQRLYRARPKTIWFSTICWTLAFFSLLGDAAIYFRIGFVVENNLIAGSFLLLSVIAVVCLAVLSLRKETDHRISVLVVMAFLFLLLCSLTWQAYQGITYVLPGG